MQEQVGVSSGHGCLRTTGTIFVSDAATHTVTFYVLLLNILLCTLLFLSVYSCCTVVTVARVSTAS